MQAKSISSTIIGDQKLRCTIENPLSIILSSNPKSATLLLVNRMNASGPLCSSLSTILKWDNRCMYSENLHRCRSYQNATTNHDWRQLERLVSSMSCRRRREHFECLLFMGAKPVTGHKDFDKAALYYWMRELHSSGYIASFSWVLIMRGRALISTLLVWRSDQRYQVKRISDTNCLTCY